MNLPSDFTCESIEYQYVVRLLDALHDSEGSNRDTAVLTVRGLDRQAVVRILSAMLKNSDPEMRCNAAEALLRLEPNQTMDLILPLFADPDSTVRWHTCGLMHDFGDKRALPPLVQLLMTDPEGDGRHIAAYALGEIGDSSVLSALRQAVELDNGTDHRGDPVRDVAAEAIANIVARC